MAQNAAGAHRARFLWGHLLQLHEQFGALAIAANGALVYAMLSSQDLGGFCQVGTLHTSSFFVCWLPWSPPGLNEKEYCVLEAANGLNGGDDGTRTR
jgi:hypothetical protein